MHTIGRIKRSESEQLTVTIQTFAGSEGIDARVFFKDTDGKWKPTKRGIRIRFDEGEALLRLIAKALNTKKDKLVDSE